MRLQWLFAWILGLYLAMTLGGCNPVGPQAMGWAGEELIYMVPYDKVQLENGKTGYIDSEGMLRGVVEKPIRAAGRKMRDVMQDLSAYTPFDRYRLLHMGPRNIEIRGAVKEPGAYPYPIDEDWSVMDMVQKVNGLTSPAESREYLLVRKSWNFLDSLILIRGEAIPIMEGGFGGDDLHLFANDILLFPGTESLIYVFGSVKTPVCFTFGKGLTPTLKVAVEHAGGFLASANTCNVQVYRLLRGEGRRIFTLEWERSPNFVLEPWDIVYCPAQIPASLIIR